MSVAEIRTAPSAPGPSSPGGGSFERQPPQDVDAEMSVLGGMLLSAEATADVVEVLRENDFYRPAHQLIFAAIVDLYTRGEPVDAITISAELARSGSIGRVGGAPYLHTLVSSVPTAANAGYYARIVADKSILRRLVEAGTRIVQLGYAPEGAEVSDVVDRAQAAIYDVTEERNTDDFMLLEQLLVPTLDEIEAIQGRDGTLSGVPTGFADLDRLTNGLHAGQMIIIAARPSLGKSTLALDFCRAASLKHGLPSVFFSLEMSRSEIVMRLLSAEARIGLGAMRTGRMNDDDWARLARRMGEVSDKPLFIDDSPNLTMMEIRSKARRLKQRHGLRLIVVDYLQLMSSPRKVESRQQEVSEISRSLKLLAKELEVPIVCLSQLNRNSEQRADRRPMISDLRESGCLTRETRLLRADTGAETTMGELFDTGARDVPLWALDDRLRLIPQTMTHVFSSGVKPVFRLRLASGREVRATGNHPFLSFDGWKALSDITVGERIAAPRHVPAPAETTEWDDRQVVMLAHLLGDGSFVRRQPIRYANVDPANLAAVEDAASLFGVTGVRDEDAAARCTALELPAPHDLTYGQRNPIAEWLDAHGLFGACSHETFVPDAVFALPKRQITLFLHHLWATGGSIHVRREGGSGPRGSVYYATTSRRLADDVGRLLWRYGIQARIESVQKAGYRDCYHVAVYGAADQRAFCRVIGANGERGTEAAALLVALDGVRPDTNIDTVPTGVWDRVRDVLLDRGVSHRAFAASMGTQSSGSASWERTPSPERLALVASVLDDADLELLATNDVAWDSVVAVEPDGVEEVFDATVLGAHNFIANGIAAHNSIEQDADMVILLHREDVYEKESPRAGEADLIVAKHRNGPTDTVTVAFQGHYSRFTDMVASS